MIEMMTSSKPGLKKGIIPVAVVVKDIIEATCSEVQDLCQSVGTVFLPAKLWPQFKDFVYVTYASGFV